MPKLQAGAKVADIGCGVGFSTLLMAQAFPKSHFIGYDFHAPSIEQANAHAKAHGLADRVRFETATAKAISERDFDLATMYDCLHDMGDPRGSAKHVRSILKPDASWMIVEPIAGDKLGDNVANPVSRLYYNASTMICVPTSMAQEVGEALGAQAGEAKLTDVLKGAASAAFAVRPRGPSTWCWKRDHKRAGARNRPLFRPPLPDLHWIAICKTSSTDFSSPWSKAEAKWTTGCMSCYASLRAEACRATIFRFILCAE